MTRARLRIGTFTPSLLIDLARSTGRLDRAGLEVTEIPVPSSPAQFRSLEAGEFDVVMTSPDNVLAYRFLQREPTRAQPAGGDPRRHRSGPRAVVVSRAVGGGRRGRPGSCGRGRRAAVGLRVRGVRPPGTRRPRPGRLQVESLGSTPRRAAALTAGTCAATVLNAGNELRAGASGCRVVSTVADIGPYLGTVMAAMPTDDPDVAGSRKRLAEAVIDTARDIVTGRLRGRSSRRRDGCSGWRTAKRRRTSSACSIAPTV